MNWAVTGFRNAIAGELFPVLTPVVENMADWIAKNKEWIATDIAQEVRQFVGAVEGIN